MSPPTPDGLHLDLLAGRYAICRLGPGQPVPDWAWHGPLASVTRTPDELSIICAEAEVSILALATFDTDYLLVLESNLARAVAALRAAGHHVHIPDAHQPPLRPDEPSDTP